jgi:hypothetical protein
MNSADNRNGYKAPDLKPNQITPSVVRDKLLKCFESANREFGKTMNQPATGNDQELKQ